MSIKVEKIYNGDTSISIEVDNLLKEYEYYLLESPRAGAFFLQIKDGFCNIITSEGIGEELYNMNEFNPEPDIVISKIDRNFQLTLPSKQKYLADKN